MPASSSQPRRISAPAERNKQPILDVLAPQLPESGTILEIASGTGQHVTHFAAALPKWQFQPSELEPEEVGMLADTIAASGLPNINPPILLDVTVLPWPIAAADAIINCNMVHISPIEASIGLFRGAASILPAGGLLFLYGPYRFQGRFLASSNAAFDESLRQRNPAWGIRDVDELSGFGAASGFALREIIEMPANNHCLLFRKA